MIEPIHTVLVGIPLLIPPTTIILLSPVLITAGDVLGDGMYPIASQLLLTLLSL